MGDLTTKYYEKSYSAYPPLTEEQRAALTEDEAAKWDEKAKSGILRNDAAIGNLPVSYTHLDVYKRQASCCAGHKWPALQIIS